MEKQYVVLFVDDEESILSALRRGLFEEDYRCLFANSGEAALELMEKETVSVIVSDMRMPVMDGLRLLKIVKEKYPRTVRIVLSGYTQLQQVLTTINQAGIFKFITKPWMLEEELKVVIQEALDYYKLQERKDELELALKKQNAAYQNMLKRVDTVVENANRQTGLSGTIAHAALTQFLERHPLSGDQAPETRELRALAGMMQQLSGASISEWSDRTEPDIASLFQRTLLTGRGIRSVDYLPSPPALTIRVNAELLAAAARCLTEQASALLTACQVKMTVKPEKEGDRKGMQLAFLFSPVSDGIEPASEADNRASGGESPLSGDGKPLPGNAGPLSENGKSLPGNERPLPGDGKSLPEPVFDMLSLVMDQILRYQDGQFVCRMTDAGLFCLLRLPARA